MSEQNSDDAVVSTPRIKNKHVRSLVEWQLAIGVAVILYFVFRTFLLRIASVDGNSMEPTLKHSDMVMLSRITYLFGEPRPGDIIAFPYKDNPSEYYIKRIIGVPGDVIELQDNHFLINGSPLLDEYSIEPVIAAGDIGFPYTVEDRRFFVLGDNRNSSKDSRYSSVGCIEKSEIIGKVILRFWPFDRFGFTG